jgi:hypothetical protein
MADQNGNYARIAGQPVELAPNQVQPALQQGAQPLTPEQAQQSAQAASDINSADQAGDAFKLGLGALSGASLGIAPAILARMGIVDPGMVRGAQTSPLYTGGEIGGMVLPSLLLPESLAAKTPMGLVEGAGGLAESAVGRLLGSSLSEDAGLLGRMALKPAQLAARGATEAALINMGHTTGEALLDNKPLSAQSLAASGLDGALFGGLIGGSMGTLGSLGEEAIGGVKKFATSAGSKRLGMGVVARRLGETEEGLNSAVASRAEGVTPAQAQLEHLKTQGEILAEGGSKLSDTTGKMLKSTEGQNEIYTKVRQEVLHDLGDVPGPDMARFGERLKATVLAPRVGEFEEGLAKTEIGKFLKNFTRSETKTETAPGSWNSEGRWVGGKTTRTEKLLDTNWEKLINSRDQYAQSIGKYAFDTNATSIRKEILSNLDSEIADYMSSTSPELADKYAAATHKMNESARMVENLGKKNANELLNVSSSIGPRDLASFGISAAFGHPIVGGALLAAKSVGKQLQGRLEPALAQYAYDSMTGAKAAASTQGVKSRIGKSLDKLFSTATKTPARALYQMRAENKDRPKMPKGPDRASYENEANRVEQLISAAHQERVRRWSEEMKAQGYPDLASEVMAANQRAAQYLMWNMPPRQAGKQHQTLRPVPIPKGLDMNEFKFMRQMKGVKGPLGLLDELDNGTLSTDSVRAMKYVYPDVHQEFVAQATQKIAEAKQEGKYLPQSKITMLGIMLDAPIDSTLEKPYVDAVQVSLQTPQQPSGQQGPAPSQPQQGQSQLAQALMTPLDKIQQG